MKYIFVGKSTSDIFEIQDGQVCSGHGKCNCGSCKCSKGYIGDFCEYKEADCPKFGSKLSDYYTEQYRKKLYECNTNPFQAKFVMARGHVNSTKLPIDSSAFAKPAGKAINVNVEMR